MRCHLSIRDGKQINFFNINFLARDPKPPTLGPQKKFMCLISWERTQKRIHINFFGRIFGVKNEVPKRANFATKSLVHCLIPALKIVAVRDCPGLLHRPEICDPVGLLQNRFRASVREISPGLLQHVLTVLVFWS